MNKTIWYLNKKTGLKWEIEVKASNVDMIALLDANVDMEITKDPTKTK